MNLLGLEGLIDAAGGEGGFDQVALLVPDLEAAVRSWAGVYGSSDWLVYTYSPTNIEDCTYRGKPGTYEMRLALVGSSPQLELIEPRSGPSIYHDWIEERGYGLHHLGFYVPSITKAISAFEARGFPTIQSGRGYGLDGDGGYAYFDLQHPLGAVLEAIEVPRRRRPSEPLHLEP